MELVSRLRRLAGDRRLDPRVPVHLPFHEVIRDRPVPSVAVDVSQGGLALTRLVQPGTLHPDRVAVELALPGTGEVIWASAETEFESYDGGVCRAGLRFLGMARKHERLLRDFVMDRRLRALALAGRRFRLFGR